MSAVPTREVARRVLATEFNDAHYTFSESDDERAPTYLLLPTGARANRVFVVGTLTETEDVGDDSEYWRGRVVDPTGTFFVYAGQYQPDAASVLREIEPPAYVAVVGKPRTYETDDGTVNVSLRPESIAVVDAETRDRWVVETAERTLDRIDHASEAGTADEYVAMADEQYGLDLDTYREAVVSALEGLESDAAADADADGASDGFDSSSEGTDESGEAEPEPVEPNAD
jgi:RPA family protein